ncbi:TIGR01777 family oxidoreductase [Flavobacterium sp. ZE23DGlu08]|uniref:TIGR01777 family oxidoreductase n=1 Tax=Flavobacterium sp. ZE23DGlu08 TaxID=3059026 RepID=UPI00265DD88F|nr:TIGR01777 family oxidoreductase [Flavobacterium sp. ZE23DGlu08]WKL44819.1 TIGR01777 family oxidoreductase [Flavobacterium sp. ZE23DGlu08]
MKKNVLISGGSGFIGSHLTGLLIAKGYSVSILSRSEKQNKGDIFYYKWDVANQTIDESAVLNADYIIHLAGENIAEKRWTVKRKAAIIDSREKSTQLLYSVIKKNNKKLDAFISASAVGIYGAVNGEEICSENTPPANDFLGYTCQKWEGALDFIENLNIRTVKIRTGLVLGKNDGFLKKLIPLFKFRLGSALGSGKQYMPWIHVDDLCNIYLQAVLNPNMEGAYNAAVNDNTTNTIFSKTLARIFGYAIWLPNVPALVLKLVMGEMAVIVLTGRRVSSDKIEETGFQFKFKNLEEALKDCLTK